ncbi:hypothetical protein [Plantactinospora sp. B24E8]|uniref:hypothetical protein n=1 Tax=Plantactinospora sp. B24E8 TaxID=3153567 RepID=UPI00325E9528
MAEPANSDPRDGTGPVLAFCTSHALDQVRAVANRVGNPPTPAPRTPTDPVPGTTDDAAAEPTAGQVLDALVQLRHLRAELATWEPRLIEAARERGASWADLAPALGVASRQAAERRYLRLRPDEAGAPPRTRDDRVRAERDRRAGNRAVARWARDNGADLRQLAGQITALTDLAPTARGDLDRLHHALGTSDPTVLVQLIADTGRHLRTDHPGLAARVDAVGEQVDEVRQHSREHRTGRD